MSPEYPGSIFVSVISTLSWFVNLSAFDSPLSEELFKIGSPGLFGAV